MRRSFALSQMLAGSTSPGLKGTTPAPAELSSTVNCVPAGSRQWVASSGSETSGTGADTGGLIAVGAGATVGAGCCVTIGVGLTAGSGVVLLTGLGVGRVGRLMGLGDGFLIGFLVGFLTGFLTGCLVGFLTGFLVEAPSSSAAALAGRMAGRLVGFFCCGRVGLCTAGFLLGSVGLVGRFTAGFFAFAISRRVDTALVSAVSPGAIVGSGAVAGLGAGAVADAGSVVRS